MSMSNTTKRVKEIRRKTRRKFSPEEKIRIGEKCAWAGGPLAARK
jgi:transposase-like protein